MSFLSVAQDLAIRYASYSMQKSLRNQLLIDILNEEIKKTPQNGKKYMLYAHVPFCHTFCPYCSFHKYGYDEAKALVYFENLRKEMVQMKEVGYDFSSMYVGGGTTLINENELLKTLELAKKLFNISEISCETDPNHIEVSNLKKFIGYIDRLSIGVQSFNDDILKKVARFDKFGSSEVLQKKLIRVVGILPVTSIDLIFNFPLQTKEMLLDDIKIAKSIGSEQITFYPLMKSNLTKSKIASSLGVSDVDNQKEFFEIICDSLKDYVRANAWSFSMKNERLKDEYVGYNHEYVGIGSGAFSFLDGKLLINAFDLNDYNNLIKNNHSALIAKCEFKPKEIIKYIFLTELFNGAININKFNQQNKANIQKDMFLELNLLKITNAIKIKNGFITTTEFGKYLCLVLMKEFYTGMDKVRAVFRDNLATKASKINIMQTKLSSDF